MNHLNAWTPRTDRVRRFRLACIMALPALLACGGDGLGGGCGGLEPSGDFPDKARVIGGIQARLSEDGFQFLGDNLEPILGSFLPDGLGTCLAGQSDQGLLGETGYCTENPCDDGSMGCQLSMEIEEARFLALPPDTIAVEVTIAEFQFVLDAVFKPFGLDLIDCDITLSSPSFPVTVPLVLRIEAPDRRLGFALGQPEFDLANLDLDLSGTLACDIIDAIFSLEFVEDLLFGAINGPVQDAVVGFAEAELCTPCGEDGACPGVSVCGAGDLCRLEAEDNRCVGKGFGVEGEFDVATLLGDFVRGNPSALSYLIQPGGFVHVEGGGVTLGIIAGTAAIPNDCVPRTNPPAATEAPPAEALRGNFDPDGESFSAAIGIDETFVDRALWTAYDGGMLCLRVDSSISDFLSSATFGLLLPSLKELTESEARPMMLVLAPQEAPEVTLGAGTMTEDPEDPGNFVMEDPLLTVGLNDMGIHFYTVVDERWVRVFTLVVDIDLPVGIAVVEGGALLPVIGDLSEALRRVEVRNNDLLAEDPAQLESLLPNLLGLALPLLGDSLLSPIDLPPLMGFQLYVQSVTGIQDNTMLGIFTGLGLAPEEAGVASSVMAKTRAELLEVSTPVSPRYGDKPKDAWPRVHIDVSRSVAGGLSGEDLEYQVKIDRTGWGMFQRAPDGVLTVRHPILIAEGDHRIFVRSRVPGLHTSMDVTPVEVVAPVQWPRAKGRLRTLGFHGRTAKPVVAAGGDGGSCGNCAIGQVTPRSSLRIPALRHPAAGLLLAILGGGGGCEDERPPGGKEAPAADGEGEGEAAGPPAECGEIPQADCSLHACDPGYVPDLRSEGRIDTTACDRVGVVCACIEGPPSPLGAVGRYVDIRRLSGGGIAFAGYNSWYGDLMFAELPEPGLPEDDQWQFIDGLPEDSPVRGAPSGPRGGIEKPGPDVGRFSSLTILADGTALIAYRDRSGDQLKLAMGTPGNAERTWAFSVIDDTPGAGTFTRSSHGADGSVAIAYRAEPAVDGDRSAALRVAWIAPGGDLVTHEVEVRSLGIPCGGGCQGADKCVIAEDACARPGGSCDGGCADDESCYEGQCKQVWAVPSLVGLPEGSPVGIAVARDPEDRLHVAWHDRVAGTLSTAVVTAEGVAEPPTVVAGAVAEGMTPGEVGRHPAIWIDADGTRHLAFVDAGSDSLMHWRLGEAEPTVVDGGYRTSQSGRVSENLVGGDAVVVRDRGGQLVVLYQDQTFLNLLAASRRNEGWFFETIAGHEPSVPGAFGFHTKALAGLEGDPGDLLVVTYKYDHSSDPPGHGLALLWR